MTNEMDEKRDYLAKEHGEKMYAEQGWCASEVAEDFRIGWDACRKELGARLSRAEFTAKDATEAHEQIRKVLWNVSGQVVELKAEVRRLREQVRFFVEPMERYLATTVNCETECDPSVGFHSPECSILNDARRILRLLNESPDENT